MKTKILLSSIRINKQNPFRMKKIFIIASLAIASLCSAQKNDKLCVPAAAFSDKAVEKSMMEAYQKRGERAKPFKVIIEDKEWYPVRNELTGIIMRRTITATIVGKRGEKCVKNSCVFAQEYDGSKYFGDIYVYGVRGESKIPCTCVDNTSETTDK